MVGSLKLVDAIVQLYRKAATELPEDVVDSLKAAQRSEEKGSLASGALSAILKNIEMAKEEVAPICQDTGTPIFRISVPKGTVTKEVENEIIEPPEGRQRKSR